MWCGLAVRAWAVASLGQAFRTTVEVDGDQPVVTRGPYRAAPPVLHRAATPPGRAGPELGWLGRAAGLHGEYPGWRSCAASGWRRPSWGGSSASRTGPTASTPSGSSPASGRRPARQGDPRPAPKIARPTGQPDQPPTPDSQSRPRPEGGRDQRRRRPPTPDRSRARRTGGRAARAGASTRSRTISTTVVGGSTSPAPHSRAPARTPAEAGYRVRCSATSSAAELPLRASSRPPARASGRHQPASRSSGATARAVTTSASGPGRTPRRGPRTTSTRSSQAERLTASTRNRSSAGQRLDQGDAEIEPGDRQHDTGQTSTRAHVYHGTTCTDQIGEDGTVEQMPVPDPGGFPRADQPAHHAVGGEQLGVLLGERGRCRKRSEPPGAAARSRQRGVRGVGSSGRSYHDPAAGLDALRLALPRPEAR